MNDLQSLVNTILTKSCFSNLFDYKMYLPQDSICLDNTISSNSDTYVCVYIYATGYLKA